MYLVAVSMSRRQVPRHGSCGWDSRVGGVPPTLSRDVYPSADQQRMWGGTGPRCQKYFRTNHVMGVTFCPYCAQGAPSLAFISKEQRSYIRAFYDAFARAYVGKKSTSLEVADVTDQTSAWHYSEEKQQFHFTCQTEGCGAETDIMGHYGYCPRCGRSNGRKLFGDKISKMVGRLEETKRTVTDRKERGEVWEEMTKAIVSELKRWPNTCDAG